ncbi:MAG TPA: Ig-like domain repeat protein [Candidatus Angelobacter sp.]|nr:Ig-like domain repeat protein [Candidatus Angelobacter sp.]
MPSIIKLNIWLTATRPTRSAPARAALFLLALALLLPMGSRGQTAQGAIQLGYGPYAMALNPITNKIYISAAGTTMAPQTSVVVIDATNWKVITTVTVGAAPCAIAVNGLTNKVYVANCNDGTISVIDGKTDTVGSPVSVGKQCNCPASVDTVSLGINMATNKVYLVDEGSIPPIVTVIDGATDTVSATVSVSPLPYGIAVNPATNIIYVGSDWQGNGAGTSGSLINVIDGNTNQAIQVAIPDDSLLIKQGAVPVIALNPVTNQVYMAIGASYVIDLDGATNNVAQITTPTALSSTALATAMAINSVANKLYIGYFDNTVHAVDMNQILAIDGATNIATYIPAGLWPHSLAFNVISNEIYAADVLFTDTGSGVGDGTLSIIDATTHASVAVPAPAVINGFGSLVTVDPITERAYVLDPGVPNPSPSFSTQEAGSVRLIDGARNATATITAGSDPFAVAIDPVLNKAYVANDGSNDVTVIDGATNATTYVPAGTNPFAVAVDPITGKAFVANQGSNSITVIGGSTGLAATVSVGTAPEAVAINPLTGMVYVANSGSSSVTVINEVTGATSTVATGSTPAALAVNPATNTIYVVDRGSNDVTVINGVTNAASSIAVGSSPSAVDVNPATNKIYVADRGDNDVTVIDGATGTTSRIPVGTMPVAVAVNPVTNKIYVVDQNSDDVTVIDGSNNAVIPVPVGSLPQAVAINVARNEVYIANGVSNDITVINGATNAISTSPGGNGPMSVAANPVTGKVYVADIGDDVTVLTERPIQQTPLITTVAPFPGNRTGAATPTFTFSTSSSYLPTPPPILDVFYQVDRLDGPWLAASASAPNFTGQSQPLAIGTHIVYAFALDAQANFNVSPFTYDSAQNIIGSISAYFFMVVPTATQTTLTSDKNPSQVGDTVNFTAVAAAVPPATGTPTGTMDFMDGGMLLDSVVLDSAGRATYSTSSLAAGTHQVTARYDGDSTFAASTSALVTQTVNENFTTSANPNALTITHGQSGTATITVKPSGGADTVAITFSCTGLPTGSNCTFNPASVTPGSNPATTVLTIQTAGSALVTPPFGVPALPPSFLLLFAFATVLGAATMLLSRRRPPLRWAPAACVVACLTFVAFTTGCGGGSSGAGVSPPPNAPTGNFTVTVHATAGSVDKTTTLALTVN